MPGLVVPSIFKAIDKITAPVRKMGKAVTGFAAKTEAGVARANRALNKLTSPIKRITSRLGAMGLIVGSAFLFSAVGDAINTFKDFEQANATLSSVMATATKPQLVALQEEAKRLGSTTAKSATEVVGLQEAFARLGFTAPEIINMTEATIAGSVAMNAELADTAELVGAVVKTFDNFSSVDTPMIMDQMTAATQKSALNFEKLQTALPIVGGAANTAGVPFTKLLALLGKLSDAGIDASSSSTALRNIFLDSAKQGLTYDQILKKIVKNQDKLTAANDEFGKRGAISAVILAKNLAATDKLDTALQGAAGTADEAAKKQLQTLNGALTILSSSYEGFILSLEDGNGTLGTALTTIVQVASEMLSLASGSAVASEELDKTGQKIRTMATVGLFLVKTIGMLVAAYIALKVALYAVSVATKIVTIATAAQNIVIGISTALQKGSIFALRGNTIAMKAFAITTKIVTAAQWLWNAAMSANPIGLIIIGIAALIALVVIVIKKWNEWGAALSLFMGPLGFIISLIQSFRRNWDMIKQAFKTGGIIGGLKAIGATILDAVLMPLQQLLELVSKVPGVGDLAASGAASIEELRQKIGVNTETDESGAPLLNAEAESEKARLERSESVEKQEVTFNVNDPNGILSPSEDDNGVPVNIGSTSGF